MKHGDKLGNVLTFYTLFCSGMIFSDFPHDAKNHFSSLVFSAALGIAAVLLYELLIFLKGKNGNITWVENPLFQIFGLLSSVGVFSSVTVSFSERLGEISEEFSSGRFTRFFILLSVLLSLFLARGNYASYSRVSFIILPFLLFSFFLTWFCFLSYGGNIRESFRGIGIDFEISYIRRFFVMFTDVLFLLFLYERSGGDGDKISHVPLISFGLFALTFVSEYIKNIIYFGVGGMYEIEHPMRTLLSLVPNMNIQELYIPLLYFSYILKSAVYINAALCFIKTLLKKSHASGKKQNILSVVFCVLFAYTAYLALDGVKSDFNTLYPYYIGTSVILVLLFIGEIYRFCASVQRTDRKEQKKL